MDTHSLPTKGNLTQAKKTLDTSKKGYDLLDQKQHVLMKEILELNQKAAAIQLDIEKTFKEAYDALEKANMAMGVGKMEQLSYCAPVEEGVQIKSRSVMGVEIPLVTLEESGSQEPFYGFTDTTENFDLAIQKFADAKRLAIEIAMIENTAYRLAVNIKKTKKRANSLKNITIPKYEELVKNIQSVLEERERDELTRLKLINMS